jgi:beta,beta-carotene 9',10'-dioxygenase
MSNRFRGGFETQLQTCSVEDLPVEGKIPEWLAGTYVRNGPGQFELKRESPDVRPRYWHWFDGLAMPHRYTFANGKLSFANRYLLTENYVQDTASDKLNFRMPATDPHRTWWQKLLSPFIMKFTDNTNINTIEMEGEYVALTERLESYCFDLQTLETLGPFKYDDNVGNVMATGHPHYDPKTKIIFNYMLRFGLRPCYELYRQTGRKHQLIAKIPTWSPSYMHSFGMTEHYLILTEYPMKLPTFAMMQFMFTDTPFFNSFVWNPQLGTMITVIDKDTGEIVKQMEVDAFFCWHHINAFERGDEIVVDLCAYADWTVVQGLYLNTMRSSEEFSTMTAEYRRYRIPLGVANGTGGHERIAPDKRIELPQIYYNRYNGRPYQYSYGVGLHDNQRDFLNQIVKIDAHEGCVDKTWHIEGHYPSEPVFAPRPGGTDEDDGVLMATIFDHYEDLRIDKSEEDKRTSYLLILDAKTLRQIAKVMLPLRIPFGFHGRWYPNGNMYAI